MNALPETIEYPEAERRWKCDRKTIKRAITAKKVTAFKPGKRVLIDVVSGDQWFLSTVIGKQPEKKQLGRPRK